MTGAEGYVTTERAIYIDGELTEAQFLRVYAILGESPSRFKGSDVYTFSTGSDIRADVLCEYLREIRVAHEREDTLRWEPPKADPQ